MRGQNSDVPAEALSGTPFEIAGGGTSPAQSVLVETDLGQLWAARLDYPDTTIARRTWVAEIIVGQKDNEILFGTRLSNVTAGDDSHFSPSRPRLIRDLLSNLSCGQDQHPLRNTKTIVDDENKFQEFEDLILDNTRKIPVIAISQNAHGCTALDPNQLLRRMSGTAHVFEITDRYCRELQAKYENHNSVFNGSIRLFRRNFNPYKDRFGTHPFWRPRIESEGDTPSISIDLVARAAFSESVRTISEKILPRFDVCRQAFSDQKQLSVKKSGNDKELIELYEQEIHRLKEESERNKAEYDQLLLDADLESAKILQIIEEVKSENHSLSYRLRSITEKLIERQDDEPTSLLSSYDDIELWSNANLAGSIWISPKAIKETKKSAQFKDIDLFSKTLILLRDIYVPMRRGTNENLWDAYQARLTSLGLEDQPCFGNKSDIKNYPAYSVMYHGQKFWCEHHIKYSGGTDPKDFFRIYYCWNETDEILLIGFMPTHLKNNLTN